MFVSLSLWHLVKMSIASSLSQFESSKTYVHTNTFFKWFIKVKFFLWAFQLHCFVCWQSLENREACHVCILLVCSDFKVLWSLHMLQFGILGIYNIGIYGECNALPIDYSFVLLLFFFPKPQTNVIQENKSPSLTAQHCQDRQSAASVDKFVHFKTISARWKCRMSKAKSEIKIWMIWIQS